MNILAVHHIQITIPKGTEAAAHDFYCGLLKLPEKEKPDSLKGRGGFWLQVGPQEVHVGSEEGIDRHKTKAHLAYLVDDLTAWGHYLTQHGFVIGDSVPIPGCHRFEFRDPFGNRIELIQPTE